MADLPVGRITFTERYPMSELRRYTIQHPAEAALTINKLQSELQRLRSALRDAMAFVDPESAKDYDAWERLLDA